MRTQQIIKTEERQQLPNEAEIIRELEGFADRMIEYAEYSAQNRNDTSINTNAMTINNGDLDNSMELVNQNEELLLIVEQNISNNNILSENVISQIAHTETLIRFYNVPIPIIFISTMLFAGVATSILYIYKRNLNMNNPTQGMGFIKRILKYLLDKL